MRLQCRRLAGDMGSIPGSGRSPGTGNGKSLQYSCLENPMDREAWWATVHGVTKSQAQLSRYACIVALQCCIGFCCCSCLVTKSCPTLWDPVDCSLPGSFLHGILQARILEWVPISFSRGSSRTRDWTRVSGIAGRHFNLWATREAQSGFKSVTSYLCDLR